MNEKQHPLILVFYIDAEMIAQRDLINPFVDSINNMIAQKESNVMAFFLPTTGEERIECLNPVGMAEPELQKINKMIEDIKASFAIGLEIDVPDEDIIINADPEPETKSQCKCGGRCKKKSKNNE